FFFFSSRRRHTRSKRDWSSDVCSSDLFRAALDRVLAALAEQIARDGEGARKLVEIVVEGAVSKRSARRIALSIANSPLVKTAIEIGRASCRERVQHGWDDVREQKK